MCQFLMKWCEEEKTNYLKLRVQLKLSQLYFAHLKFQPALDIISELLAEVRKQDDKHMLVETYLIESKIYFSLENFAKSKVKFSQICLFVVLIFFFFFGVYTLPSQFPPLLLGMLTDSQTVSMRAGLTDSCESNFQPNLHCAQTASRNRLLEWNSASAGA